ncbi:hypothetical protein K2X40_00095 [Candidatus Babeliales bacterium]|nr:hypothetical protein [Candidatus Babeliales bacterium]
MILRTVLMMLALLASNVQLYGAGKIESGIKLLDALKQGDADVFEILLRQGVDVNASFYLGCHYYTLLSYSVSHKNKEMVALLLRYGARIPKRWNIARLSTTAEIKELLNEVRFREWQIEELRKNLLRTFGTKLLKHGLVLED